MIIELDVYRSATLMIERHGNKAACEAARHAEALMKTGDVAGVATWLRVVEAVRGLQGREPPPGAPTVLRR